MNNIKTFLSLLFLFSILISGKTFPQAGQLDPTFGQGGIVTTAINTGDNDNRIRSTAIQDDGKIVTAGYIVDGNSLFAIARYNADGSQDNSFGTNGIVITPIGNNNINSRALSVSIQDDGKIVAAGYSEANGNDDDIVLTRYNTNGGLDNSFGIEGIVITPIGVLDDRANSITIQSDDKIVVGGYSDNGNNIDFALVRYNPDGTLDTTFASNGIVTTPIGMANDIAASVSLQSDGKIVAAGYSYDAGNIDFAIVRYNSDGTLDNAFGTGGTLTTPVGTLNDVAQSLAIQNDGKIITAGYTFNGNDNDFAVVRYNSDGTLDNSFGTGGVVITLIGNSNDRILSTLIQDDGKIVAAGYSDNGNNNDFVLVRYNTSGELDNAFGTSGIVTTSIGATNSVARSVALSSDGKIVAAGYSDNGSDDDFAIVRFNTNGDLDNTFGTDGIVTTPIGASYNIGSSSALQDDGKIIAVGYTENHQGNLDFAIIRYNTNGSLDNTFGAGGIVTTPIGLTTQDIAYSVAIQSDGKIIAAGSTEIGSDEEFAIVRYNSNGFLDNTFGTGGIVTSPFGSLYEVINSIAIQSDGKIVVAGYSRNESNNDFALARYNTNGSLDNTFGTNGTVITHIRQKKSIANSMAIQSDGKIVLAGFSSNGNDNDFAITRYNTDGSLDNTFGTSGVVITPIGTSFDVAQAVAIQGDGKIIAAGYYYTNTGVSGDDIAVVRYNSNGTLDNTFGTNGIVMTPLGSLDDYIYSVVIQENEKIVAAGYSINGDDSNDIAIVRFNPNGTLDNTFGTNGITTTRIGASNSRAGSLAIQSDGSIVAVGYSKVSSFNFSTFTVVRYAGDPVTGLIRENKGEIPSAFVLEQNYPNPFNPVTKISWQSPVSGHQTLKIYDILGNEVATLVNENRPAGSYQLSFDASGLPSGIYFYNLSAGSFNETKKLILMK